MPGMEPLGQLDWIVVDDGYSAQLREKARLFETQRQTVSETLRDADAAVNEVLEQVLVLLQERADFSVSGNRVVRPDGEIVEVDSEDPLLTISKLIQEDICILQKQDDEHVLTAALLCFPASWTLAEKIGKPLIRIHAPVQSYDSSIAKRVQRLFDGVQIGKPMWRSNRLAYVDPTLFHPRQEDKPRAEDHANAKFDRSERQTVWRLPKTGAVVFSIHTTVTAI